MALSDLYQATVKAVYSITGETVENVFYFRKATGLGTATKLIDALADTGGYLELMTNLMHEDLVISEVACLCLGDLEDFEYRGFILPGGGTGDMLPLHDALNVTLKLSTRAIRPGSKRIAGIPEDVVVNGVFTDATYISSITAFTGQMGEEQDDGTGVTFQQVVIKRVFVPADLPDHGAFYRLPEGLETPVVGDVVVGLANNRVSHQVSRGNGR